MYISERPDGTCAFYSLSTALTKVWLADSWETWPGASPLCAHSFVVDDIYTDLKADNEIEKNSLEYCDISSQFGLFTAIESPTRLRTEKKTDWSEILNANNVSYAFKDSLKIHSKLNCLVTPKMSKNKHNVPIFKLPWMTSDL